MIRCPVEEVGRDSVTPSTTPSVIASRARSSAAGAGAVTGAGGRAGDWAASGAQPSATKARNESSGRTRVGFSFAAVEQFYLRRGVATAHFGRDVIACRTHLPALRRPRSRSGAGGD